MAKSPKFAKLLTKAVRTIAAHENKTITSVHDELGYALGRKTGGSCIEYWRKGHVPTDLHELEKLVGELARRGGLNRSECEQFLHAANHPYLENVLDELSPILNGEPLKQERSLQELSPFVAGPPITTPRQFVGREYELRRIFGLWRRFPLQHMAVIGARRSGKTSLLHYLMNITRAKPSELRPGQRSDWLPRPERYRWVFVDFQDARMGNRDRLLRHLLVSLDIPAPASCDLDIFMDLASAHLQTPTVILIDEIEAGLAAPELDEPFWWSLRSLVNNSMGGNLAFLLMSCGPPDRVARDYNKPSPFFNIFHTLELGPFTDAEARELIASSPRPFASADTAWILDQSGRWPCLLQILCQTRLTAIEESETDNFWRDEGLRQIAPFRYLLEQ